jgi:hypothetical protein
MANPDLLAQRVDRPISVGLFLAMAADPAVVAKKIASPLGAVAVAEHCQWALDWLAVVVVGNQ